MMRDPPDADTPGLVANRACRNCVQVKVKCIPLDSSSGRICQRCHRLKKSCTTPAPVIRKGRAKSTRVTQLEQRIDRLTALLTPAPSGPVQTTLNLASTVAFDTITASAHTTTQPTPPESTASKGSPVPLRILDGTPVEGPRVSTRPISQDVGNHSDGLICSANGSVEYGSGPWANGNQPINRSGSPALFHPSVPFRRDGSQLAHEYFCPVHLDSDFEDRLFQEFRTKMLKHAPFVVLGNVSAEEFKERKPFAYWAAVASASFRDRKLHYRLHEEMLKAVGHRMLVAGGKTLDLLQGLLLICAWHHYIAHAQPQFMNLLHLAQALLADMGIGKPVRKQDTHRLASESNAFIHGVETTAIIMDGDRRRALLGVYILSSRAAFAHDRMDPMRYSEHIDDTCKALTDAAEYESDMLLVHLTQLHRILGKYYHKDALGNTAPSAVFRAIFQEEVQRYRQTLPPSLQGHHLLEMEINSNAMSLLEPSYETSTQDHMDRLGALHACVDAGHKFIDTVVSLPDNERTHQTILLTMGLIQTMVILTRLAFFRADGWDTKYAQKVTDLPMFLSKAKTNYEAAHRYEAEAYPGYKPWRFAMYAEKTKHILVWYEAKLAAQEAASSAGTAETLSADFGDAFFGSFDDAIWQDLMRNWTDFPS